jgi:hypothetical protein
VPISTALSTVSTLAYLALTAAGLILWWRTRSAASALVAVGFAMVLADQLALVIQDYQFNAILRGHAGDTFFIIHHHLILRYVALIGLCLAAVGLVWHAARVAARPGVS